MHLGAREPGAHTPAGFARASDSIPAGTWEEQAVALAGGGPATTPERVVKAEGHGVAAPLSYVSAPALHRQVFPDSALLWS